MERWRGGGIEGLPRWNINGSIHPTYSSSLSNQYGDELVNDGACASVSAGHDRL